MKCKYERKNKKISMILSAKSEHLTALYKTKEKAG